jgi:two-component system chemotaxis response regulator CheY
VVSESDRGSHENMGHSPNPFNEHHDDELSSETASVRLRSDLRILIVEDFSTMRRIIHNLLSDLGYRCISEADDGLSALPILHNGRFDFVITDLFMPNMSGLELLRAIRADRNLSHIPVLMITADAQREQIIDAAKAGVNGYIVKPFNAAILESKILRIFQRIYD